MRAMTSSSSGGVDEGAKVVVLGVQKLDPAQKVRVVSSLSFSGSSLRRETVASLARNDEAGDQGR